MFSFWFNKMMCSLPPHWNLISTTIKFPNDAWHHYSWNNLHWLCSDSCSLRVDFVQILEIIFTDNILIEYTVIFLGLKWSQVLEYVIVLHYLASISSKWRFNHDSEFSGFFLSSCSRIQGTTAIEITSGLHWYLKYWCGAHVSWDKTGGAQLASVPKPGSLPPVKNEGLIIKLSVPWNYYQNVVTSSCKNHCWPFLLLSSVNFFKLYFLLVNLFLNYIDAVNIILCWAHCI